MKECAHVFKNFFVGSDLNLAIGGGPIVVDLCCLCGRTKDAIEKEKEIAGIYRHLELQQIKGARFEVTIEQQESDARIGRLVLQGIKEVLPHTGCKGEYHCLGCWEVLKTNYHGCVLQYYCPTRKEGIR